VRADPDLFVQVSVGTTSFARTKLAAVPFALETERAQVAASAEAGAINEAALENGAVTTAKLANAAVTVDKVADDVVPEITAWEPYNVSFQNQAGAPIPATLATGVFRRVGDSVEVSIVVVANNDTDNIDQRMFFTLPVPMDNARMAGGGDVMGSALIVVQTNVLGVVVQSDASRVSVVAQGSFNPATTQTPEPIDNAGESIRLHFTYPAVGFAVATGG
jgi:hypothetical protein